MFLHHLVEMGGFELNHHWHGIDMLIVLECCLLATLLATSAALLAKFWGRARLKTAAIILSLTFATAAYAANTALSALSASGAIAGGNLFYVVQTVGVGGVKATATQIATFINSLFSGDATVASGGAVTLATVNGNVGSFGSATNCTTLTVNAKGLITAISQTACAPGIASLTGAGTGILTALGINVGSAGAPVLFNGAGGTPSSITLTNGTALPIAGLAGLGTGVGTFLGTPSSANLLAALTTKTGTGNAVFGSAPTIDSLNATTALTLAFLTGSTQCLQVNTSGVVSGTGAVCGGSGSSGANPTATAGDVAVNGVSTSFLRADGAPAIQKASSSLFGIAKVDNTTITAAAGVISAVNNGTVTSVSAGCGTSTGGSPITTTGTVTAAVTARTNSTTSDTIVSTDCGNIVYQNNASAIAVALATAGTAGFGNGAFFPVCNINAGIATITSASNIGGSASPYALPGGTALNPVCVTLQSTGAAYNLVPEYQVNASLLTAGTVNAARLPFGTGVGTAAAASLSAAGGLTSTIASGTSAMGTGAITSATCATVVTTAATNTATTDVVLASFNGDPTAVTGYIPATAGMLTIIAYPTANNVNFKVCNNTTGSITPGGVITLNWRVVR